MSLTGEKRHAKAGWPPEPEIPTLPAEEGGTAGWAGQAPLWAPGGEKVPIAWVKPTMFQLRIVTDETMRGRVEGGRVEG